MKASMHMGKITRGIKQKAKHKQVKKSLDNKTNNYNLQVILLSFFDNSSHIIHIEMVSYLIREE
jgi:hypothetical protein